MPLSTATINTQAHSAVHSTSERLASRTQATQLGALQQSWVHAALPGLSPPLPSRKYRKLRHPQTRPRKGSMPGRVQVTRRATLQGPESPRPQPLPHTPPCLGPHRPGQQLLCQLMTPRNWDKTQLGQRAGGKWETGQGSPGSRAGKACPRARVVHHGPAGSRVTGMSRTNEGRDRRRDTAQRGGRSLS